MKVSLVIAHHPDGRWVVIGVNDREGLSAEELAVQWNIHEGTGNEPVEELKRLGWVVIEREVEIPSLLDAICEKSKGV